MANQGSAAETAVPEAGALMYDPAKRKVGEYRGMAGPYAILRPVGGGREWEADPGLIRLATPAERLSFGVKAVSERSGRVL